jgi:hypothetical protein
MFTKVAGACEDNVSESRAFKSKFLGGYCLNQANATFSKNRSFKAEAKQSAMKVILEASKRGLYSPDRDAHIGSSVISSEDVG